MAPARNSKGQFVARKRRRRNPGKGRGRMQVPSLAAIQRQERAETADAKAGKRRDDAEFRRLHAESERLRRLIDAAYARGDDAAVKRYGAQHVKAVEAESANLRRITALPVTLFRYHR